MEQKRQYLAGDGTKENPFEIWNEEELLTFSRQCMQETEYLYYMLKNDLDLSSYLWKPIAAIESQLENRKWRRGFCGSLDGGMHSIIGIRLRPTKAEEELHCLGLFAMLGGHDNYDPRSPEVKNLQVQYETQTCYLNAADTYYGGIAGMVYNSQVKHCLVSGNLIFEGEKKGLYAGGIAGMLRDSSKWEKDASSRLIDSSFRGSLIVRMKNEELPKVYLGGIAGSLQSNHCEIKHCISNSFLYGSFTGNMAGSIMGGMVNE